MKGVDLELASTTFGFEGEVVEIELTAGSVALVVTLDSGEHERRQEAAIAAIADRPTITALFELPLHVDVPRSTIATWVLDRLARMPAAARTGAHGYQRVVQPPVRIVGALASGHDLRRLLARVGQLSAIAPMAMVVDRPISRSDPALLDAGLYGMGLAVAQGRDIEVILRPQPVVPRPGPYLWWLAELAYERLLEDVTSGGPTR